ncbi:MAG TPA: nucleotide exchange factor GrpE [Patescibacteria group bacterium]
MVKKHKETPEEIKFKAKVDELENNYKRVLADYHNQERRFKENQSQVILMANASLIEKILVSLDVLKLAERHLQDKGLKMAIDQLLNTLTQEGLEEIPSNDVEFDPMTMDCTEIVPGKKNRVIETISTGYYLSGKVLRPAKVKVGSGE